MSSNERILKTSEIAVNFYNRPIFWVTYRSSTMKAKTGTNTINWPGIFWSFLAVFALLCGLTGTANAQFSTDPVAGSSSGGGATMLTVDSTGGGTAVINVSEANIVFLGNVPAGLAVQFTGPDDSGQGTAQVVAAKGSFFTGAKYCFTGVGADWGKMACAPLVDGKAAVKISIGKAPATTQQFALVPLIVGADGQRLGGGWAAHAENARSFAACPATKGRDVVTVLTIEGGTGVIRLATPEERAAYATNRYPRLCAR